MKSAQEIVERLISLGNPEKAEFKAKKFNINAQNTLGIYQSDLNQIVKEVGKNSALAIELFDTEIYEGKLLCGKIFDPKDATSDLMEEWIKSFDNWEICDTFCMKLFANSPMALDKINEWVDREEEFERRASFATMAGYCSSNKKAENEVFEAFFPLILKAADDNRVYVKKAVSWALRSIGKRNIDLKSKAICCAEEMKNIDAKSAQWIANDVLKELKTPGVRVSDYPRKIYRK